MTGVVARQEHSRATATASVPVPPEELKEDAGDETVASHRLDAGAVMFVEVEAELPQLSAAIVAAAAAKSRGARVLTCPVGARLPPDGGRRGLLMQGRDLPGGWCSVLQSGSPAEHNLRNFLRYRIRGPRLRQLCLLLAALVISGCAGGYQLRPHASLGSGSLHSIAWHEPVLARDRENIGRWREGVGSPILIASTAASPAADTLTLVSWNIALDRGDIARVVGDLQARAPGTPIVLLLQEAFRSGDDIPLSPAAAAFAGFLGSSNVTREIDDVARALGFSLYYVPSMRNGAPARYREDRGNAILSSVPLEGLTAIELPFEHQRRVALAAHVRGVTSRGEPWRLRLATVHLDNIVGARHGWIGGEYGRTRQARGLREALRGEDPLVLAGDFNTWFGFSDQAYLETAREYPQTRLTDTRRTFRGLLRLDHVFYRLPEGWTADIRRAESSYGSDHYPLIATINF